MQSIRIVRRKSGIFTVWLISYISLLIVPVITSLLLYIVSDKVIAGEINKANESSMKHLQQIMDDHLQSLRRVSIDVGWDRQVSDLMHSRSPLNHMDQPAMVETIKSLRVHSTANSLIDFLYIFFRNENRVLSSTASYSYEEIYDLYHKGDRFSYEAWIKSMKSIHTWDYTLMPRIATSGQVSNHMAFLQTIPVETPYTPLGTVVILIDQEKLVKVLADARWVEESNILILDKSDTVIASASPVDFPESISYKSLDQSKALLNAHIMGEDVIVTHIDSAVSNWKYISIVPKRIFLSKAKFVRNLTLTGILLCLIISGVAAYRMAKRNYNPVKRILETLSNRAGITFHRETNEFDFIDQSIELTVGQKEEISQKLKSHLGVLQLNFIVSLLKGNYKGDVSIEEALRNYDLEFCSEYFAVMVFDIDNVNSFYPKEEEKAPGDGIKLAKYVIANVIEELVKERNRAFTVETDDTVVCLINFTDGELDIGTDELKRIAFKMIEVVQNQLKIHFTGAVSNIHESVFGISEAYHEALEALEYKFVVGMGQIISYSYIKEAGPEESYNYEFTLETQQRFMNCIKTGDMERAGQIIEEVIDLTLCQASIPIDLAKCMMFAMANTMISAVKELSIVCDKAFLDKLNPVERLLQCKTVVDMKREIKTILDRVGEYIAASMEQRNNTLVPEIKQYIHKNYYDPNINVSAIAQVFDMNAVYLSRHFKEKTGESLLDYINGVKLQKAQVLLAKEDANINEIAKIVGYNNSNAFIRTFKKYKGITPGKYREINS